MLVSFNPTISSNKPQSVNFKSLKDGRIVAEEVAKHTFAAEDCGHSIILGAYKPTLENLKALLKAREIGAKHPSQNKSIVMRIDEAIESLKTKAKEAGITYSCL